MPLSLRHLCKPLQNERGVTLMVVLVMVVVLGLAAGMAGSTWKTIMQRERETELLFRGDQIRRAIQGYYTFRQGQSPLTDRSRSAQSGPFPRRVGAGPGGGSYPASLEDLLRDPRSAGKMRHLRQVYNDPITRGDWELIKDPGGRIKGVRSSSKEVPFKQDGFPLGYETFKGAQSYSDWQFVYEPGQLQSANSTGGTMIKGLPGMQNQSQPGTKTSASEED